jgi:uncharacterized protein (TIGR02118 family)
VFVIKAIWACNRKSDIPDSEFYTWWRDVHGVQEWRPQEGLRRYVQHHTLAEARVASPHPTHDGASIGWFDSFEAMRDTFAQPRNPPWSTTRFQPQMDVAIATEQVVIDGDTRAEMVKAIFIAARHPRLSVDEYQQRWREVHGELWSRVPGIRRYVQNHAVTEAYGQPYDPNRPDRTATHDGWAEFWFDDLASLRHAMITPEGMAAREEAAGLFASPRSIVIARETPIKG